MRNAKWRWRLRREYLWGDARRSAESRLPVSSFPNIDRWAANDKDFSLALEMTTRESPMSPSLLVF